MTGPEHYQRAEALLAGRNGRAGSLGVKDADEAIRPAA